MPAEPGLPVRFVGGLRRVGRRSALRPATHWRLVVGGSRYSVCANPRPPSGVRSVLSSRRQRRRSHPVAPDGLALAARTGRVARHLRSVAGAGPAAARDRCRLPCHGVRAVRGRGPRHAGAGGAALAPRRGGVYRYVRNPMYVAVLACIVGQALLLNQPEAGLWRGRCAGHGRVHTALRGADAAPPVRGRLRGVPGRGGTRSSRRPDRVPWPRVGTAPRLRLRSSATR
jgi:hypothetical protein